MSGLPENAKKLTVTFSRSKDYRTMYADGTYVGRSVGGDITLDFFVGNYAIEDEVYVKGEEGFKKQNGMAESGEYKYLREFQIKVVLTPDVAESLLQLIKNELNRREEKEE